MRKGGWPQGLLRRQKSPLADAMTPDAMTPVIEIGWMEPSEGMAPSRLVFRFACPLN